MSRKERKEEELGMGVGVGAVQGKVLCDLVFGHNNIANRSVLQCTHNYRANVCDGR